jgi:K+-transporting ATPase ATPase C chain
MRQHLRPTVILLGAFTVLLGFLYPAAVTVLGRAAFPSQADGSLIRRDDAIVGSALIGQPFDDPRYFWSRPSATTPAYNAGASTGSNLGPLNPALTQAVAKRIRALREADPGNSAPVPVDLVTASGSGLDPHVSPAAATYQVPRVARLRGLPADSVAALVRRHTEGRTFGLLGEPRVNVLRLNLAVDSLSKGAQ